MNARRVATSAPGSLMLMGEHAALRNHPALVASVNLRLSLELIPRQEPMLKIDSRVGSAMFSPSDLPSEGPFRFVTACIRSCADFFTEGGFDLIIRSELPTTVGLGSSAALVVALMHALHVLQDRQADEMALHEDALRVIRQVQGRGSGADVAASVFGGCVAYCVEPRELRKLRGLPPLTVYYSGSKRPTPEVVAEVDALESRHPELMKAIFETMGALSLQAEAAMQAQNWTQLGELMNLGQGLMDAIGVNNARLSEMNYALREAEGVLGSKISGSGLGDCVIALGDVPAYVLSSDRVEVRLGKDGVREETS